MSTDFNISEKFQLELNRGGYNNTYKALIANIINSSLLAIALWPYHSETHIIFWLAFTLVVCLVRVQLVRIFNSVSQSSQSKLIWQKLMTVGLFFCACIWAIPSIFLFPPENESVQVFIAFVIGGMAAGSLTSLSHSKLSLHLFLSILIAPLFLRFVFSDSPFSHYMAFMIFLGYVMTLVSGLKLNSDLIKLINLKIENTLQKNVISQSRNKYAAIINQAADAYFLVDSQGFIQDTNLQACKSVGYGQIELLNLDIRSILVDFEDSFSALTGRSSSQTEVLHFNCTQQNLDQTRLPVDVSVGAINIDDNQYFSIFVRDISEQYKQQKNLTQAKDKIDFLLEHTPLGYIGTDIAGLVTDWNPAAEHIFGYQRSKMLRQDPQDYLLDKQNRTLVQESQEKVLNSKNSESIINENVCKDGRVIICEWFNTPILDERDNLIGVASFVQDITQSVKDKQALTKAKSQSEKANNAKSEFLSRMSHELRTPMNAIMGFNQLLELSETLSEEDKDGVVEIKHAAQHLLKLINEILELSKIEAGKMTVSLETVDLQSLITESVALMNPLSSKPNITMTVDMENNLLVTADHMRLKQCLLNLLSNAIKYNHKNGTVSIKTTHMEDFIRISVQDSGLGIPEDQKEQLFVPFERLGRDATLSDGTGIGLTITRSLIQLMGGKIDFESTENAGSTFWIELPKVPNQLIASAEQASNEFFNIRSTIPSPKQDLSPQQTQSIVLYIEDNTSNIRLVERLLTKYSNLVLTSAHEPELGIELALLSPPKLILLDISMPKMDGYQVLNILKSKTELLDVPVVAITANAMPEDIQKGKEAGFEEYLTKPLNVDKFYSVIEDLVKDSI